MSHIFGGSALENRSLIKRIKKDNPELVSATFRPVLNGSGEIGLDDFYASRDYIGHLSNALASNRNLLYLNLWGLNPRSTGWATLGAALSVNDTLTQLDISNSHMCDFSFFERVFSSNSTITKLDGYGGFDRDWVYSFAERNKSLFQLQLQDLNWFIHEEYWLDEVTWENETSETNSQDPVSIPACE